MRQVICVILLLVISVAAKNKPSVQPAPLPKEVTNAKKIFILKGVGATARTVAGGYDLAFDAFYAEIKKWGHFDIVASPDEADLVFEVSYTVENGGTRVWSSTDTSTGATQVHSAQVVSAQLTAVIYDARNKTPLWSSAVVPGMAFFKASQEKEMIKAGDKLASNIEQRVELSVSDSMHTGSQTGSVK